jgi:hypothetical protein
MGDVGQPSRGLLGALWQSGSILVGSCCGCMAVGALLTRGPQLGRHLVGLRQYGGIGEGAPSLGALCTRRFGFIVAFISWGSCARWLSLVSMGVLGRCRAQGLARGSVHTGRLALLLYGHRVSECVRGRYWRDRVSSLRVLAAWGIRPSGALGIGGECAVGIPAVRRSRGRVRWVHRVVLFRRVHGQRRGRRPSS